jgi:Domain of unknown function (DUF4386)
MATSLSGSRNYARASLLCGLAGALLVARCLTCASGSFRLVDGSAGGPLDERGPSSIVPEEAKALDDSMKWERYGALGGILFVVLVIASIAVSGSNVKSSDSAAKILQSFHDNKDGITVSAFLGGVAALPILWWAGSLYGRMRRAEGGQPRLALIAVLSLVFAGATQTGTGVIDATVALTVKTVGATEAKFFFVLGQGLSAASSVGLAALVLAVSVLALRTRVFPSWLGWVGVVDALAFLVASYAVATTSDGIGGVGFVAFIIWAIWIIVVSVIMFRAKEPTPAIQ